MRSEESRHEPNDPNLGNLVLLVPSDIVGRDDRELGEILIRSFAHTLAEVEPRPDTAIFLNTGVRLVVQGSPVLEDLLTLEQRGTKILACGTCLGHFELKERLAVGEISNMYTIAETLLRAQKVVSV